MHDLQNATWACWGEVTAKYLRFECDRSTSHALRLRGGNEFAGNDG